MAVSPSSAVSPVVLEVKRRARYACTVEEHYGSLDVSKKHVKVGLCVVRLQASATTRFPRYNAISM